MKNNIDIVMLGDSLTHRANWKNLLQNEQIINLGIDGNTTKDLLKRIDAIDGINPKIIFIMIGINDLCTSIPLDTIFENYKKILEKLENSTSTIAVQGVLVTQMPAVNKKVLIFNSLLKEYCIKQKLIYFDLNTNFSNEKGLLREDLTTDGLHLGQKAYKVWAYKINRHYLKKYL